MEAAQQEVSGFWQAAEGKLYYGVDQYYLKRYDRRAKPQPTPTATPPGAVK